MGFEAEKQIEVVKTSSMGTAATAIATVRRRRKPKSTKKKRHRGRPDAGVPGRKEALRQRRWLFNGVGVTAIVVVLVILWAAFFGDGQNQKLGQDGLGQLIAVSMFFAGQAVKSARRKPE